MSRHEQLPLKPHRHWAHVVPDLLLERLKELLDYDPVTGIFRWRVTKGSRAIAGTVAGTLNADGYMHLTIDGHQFKAHRLAWFYVHGVWPKEFISPERKRSDYLIAELREAVVQNARNRKLDKDSCSGLKGVSWCKTRKRWIVRITCDGKVRRVGRYGSLLAAEIARGQAAALLHGEFASS